MQVAAVRSPCPDPSAWCAARPSDRSVIRRRATLVIVFTGVALLAGLEAVAATVTFGPDLITVSAVHDDVDYEATSVVKDVSPAGYARLIRWVREDRSAPGGRVETSTRKLIRAEDVASARRLVLVWIPGDPESMPGSLTGRISQLQFQELKQTGTTAFVLGMTPGAAGADVFGGLLAGRKYYRGNLQRMGSGSVPFSVLLDGQRTTLPALQLRGRVAVGTESGDAELWVLDDARLPLVLRWSALGSSVTTVKIDNPPAPRSQGNAGGGGLDLTKALSSGDCRVEAYGIYFNTGSAVLLPESQAALARIAALVHAHPDWTLTIEGHTDSMGSAASNLTLSKARAMAVRDALIRSQGVAAQQLSAAGFGATRPVESNGTLEGRARNRRVELARRCP